MKGLQNIFQVLIKPGFLILFLFGFLGSDCGRVTEGGSDSTPPNTEEILAEQQAKADAAAQAAEEAKRKAEEARQAGDAAKAAEAERKQREAEAEAEKQRQIQTALQTAAPAVLRIYDAIKRVAAAKEQVAGTSFASGKPFSGLEEATNAAKKEALKAFGAISRSEETSAAFDRAEEVALAANKTDQQAQVAEEFVSGFQSLFTTNFNEKALVPSSSDKTNDEQFESQCVNHLRNLFQPLPDNLSPVLPDHGIFSGLDGLEGVCQAKPQAGPPGPTSYNCFCVYDDQSFYKR